MKLFIRKTFVSMTLALGFLALNYPVNAQFSVGIGINVGGPPPRPPVIVERRWAPPSPGAYWVEPHWEWIRGRWIWIHGYYEYPPRRGVVYYPARYENRGGSYVYIHGGWR